VLCWRTIDYHDAEKAFFQGIRENIYVLAIGEDWCPDVYNNLAVMARISALNPKIQRTGDAARITRDIPEGREIRGGQRAEH
jgi:hypothetical protein